MRLIYYWNILLLVALCACVAEVGERDNPFDDGADMTDYERDVYGWSKGSEGEAKHGNISKSCYVYENKIWRVGNDYDCSLGFGGCIVALQDSLRKGDFWYKCDTLVWRRASTIETDTAGWGEVKDGEVRVGRVNDSIYYIYEKNKKAWREATPLEYDTYDYTNNKDWATGKDGDSKVGSVNANNCYVFEDKVWRVGNTNDCALNLRGCTSLRQDTVGKGSDKVWYICDAKSWWRATTYEKDTYGWKDSSDGAIRKGNVTDTVYVFDKAAWRVANNVEAKLGGCVTAIADSVGKVGLIYYVCKSGAWITATAFEYDTYKWSAGKDGDCKVGNVNTDDCYVYEDNVWRIGTSNDCSLGLRGCTALRQDTVGLGSDNVWYVCVAKSWWNATTYVKDTFGWKDSTDGAIKKGNVTDTVYVFDETAWRVTDNIEAKLGGCVTANVDSVGKVGPIYYICKSNKWIEASAIEYDTYKWSAGKDGDCKVGSVNTDNCYVYENNVWRSGTSNDCSLGLRGCTALRRKTVGLGSDNVWYICDAKSWWHATTYEKDTFGWRDSTDGAVKKGNVTDTIYVFDKTSWRRASNVEEKFGGCVTAIADSVGKVGLTYYICKSNKWIEASAIEYDTYRWTAGKDGEVREGQVNKTIYYIYEANTKSWRNATTLEKDTYDYSNNRAWLAGTDGEIKRGSLTDSVYVYDATAWRTADDIESVLGGCVTAIADSVGKIGPIYYICKSNQWVEASAIEYDTYRWSADKDGQIKKGNVTDTFYVYDDEYRVATAREIYINQGCTVYNEGAINVRSDTSDYICKQHQWVVYHNQMVDTRDNQTYLTVRIGKQIWMAQDLNYTDASLDGATCSYQDANTSSCSEIGCGCSYGTRLYLWTAAMNLPSDYLTNIYGGTSQVQGICPKGWHLPSKNEFEVLIDFWGGSVKAWFALNGYRYPKNDDFSPYVENYSFDVYEDSGEWYGVGSSNCGSGGGGVWTSSEENADDAKAFFLSLLYIEMGDNLVKNWTKQCGMPVHCIKDE